MATSTRISLLLLLATACGFPRPADVGDDAPGDASEPSVIVHVSPTGADANDGLTQPVKTLKRAIAIAGTNTEITTIALAAGRYTAAAGEKFPYTVPTSVTIAGPATGGAILTGTKSEAGLALDTGKLQDLELEDFTVAIAATGTARITNLRVRTSMLAVRGETTARLTIDNLDVTGAVDVCGSGIELKGTADLAATTLTTRNLVTTLKAVDLSTINIAMAAITGDPRCLGVAFVVNTSKNFTLSDSIVIGTYSGISISGTPSSPTQVTITNTVLRNMQDIALQGGSVMFRMTGGEISNNGGVGLYSSAGAWSFTNVKISRNMRGGGLYLSGSGPQALAILTMRGCTVTDNRDGGGVQLFDFSVADLGTDANPGNNTFQGNLPVGLLVYGSAGPQQVDAVGNTWNAGVQGADTTTGSYPIPGATIIGPVDQVANNNFAIWSGLSLRR